MMMFYRVIINPQLNLYISPNFYTKCSYIFPMHISYRMLNYVTKYISFFKTNYQYLMLSFIIYCIVNIVPVNNLWYALVSQRKNMYVCDQKQYLYMFP